MTYRWKAQLRDKKHWIVCHCAIESLRTFFFLDQQKTLSAAIGCDGYIHWSVGRLVGRSLIRWLKPSTECQNKMCFPPERWEWISGFVSVAFNMKLIVSMVMWLGNVQALNRIRNWWWSCNNWRQNNDGQKPFDSSVTRHLWHQKCEIEEKYEFFIKFQFVSDIV